jgi:hypothetical protein
MLIVDEIGMVSSILLLSIDTRCKIVKNLDGNSTAFFKGLHVAIVLGDFHQFSPIQARALWQPQRNSSEERGQRLAKMFCLNDVADYHRVRNATAIHEDVDMLNSKVIGKLEVRRIALITPASYEQINFGI